MWNRPHGTLLIAAIFKTVRWLSSLYCNLISSNNHPSHHLEQSTDMSSAVRPHASYNTTLLAVQIKPKGILGSDLTLYIQLISNSERILRISWY